MWDAYDRSSRVASPPLSYRWTIPPSHSAGDRPMDVRSRLEHALGAAYSIDRELTGGGMSHVYVADERAFGRRVVVKALREDLTEGASAARFKREISVAAKLQHPHIVPLLSAGEEGGTLYYTMPFVEGESLRARLNREGELPIADVVRVLREVASALAYAHRQGIVHRDIKPENVLFSDGNALVTDFGIAKALEAARTQGDEKSGTISQLGVALGTPAYMAPEQGAADPTVDHRADLYSLGCVGYEMLTGRPPFEGRATRQLMAAHATEAPTPIGTRRASAPPALTALVMQCLEKSAADRPQSASDVLRALDGIAITPVGTVPSPHTARRRGFGWVAIAAAAGLAVGVTGEKLSQTDHAATDPANIEFAQRTFTREQIVNARWGADGKTILYSVVTGANVPSMRIVRPEYPAPQPFGPEVAHLLAVSSTNEVALLLRPRFLFQRIFLGTLARMSIGGAPREIVDNVEEADWSPDGTQLAITRTVGGRDQIEYPVGKVLFSAPGSVSDLRVSADGQRIAFFLHPLRGDDRGFVAVVDTKGTVTRLEEEFLMLEGMAWASDDRTALFSSGELRRWHVGDRASHKALANAGRLTIYDVRAGHWLVTRDDPTLTIAVRSPPDTKVRDLSWLDGSSGPLMSPDGEMIAFSDQGAFGGAHYGTMIRKTDGSPAVRLGDGNAVAISRDKQWVVGAIPTSPVQFRLYPTGAGPSHPVEWAKLVTHYWITFLPDGKSLWVCGNEKDRPHRCYTSGLEGGELTPQTPDSVIGLLRPDGKAIARTNDEKWWLYPLGGGSPREIPGLNQVPLRWSPDGTALWVLADPASSQRRVERVDVATGKRTVLFPIDDPPGIATPSVQSISVADDGRSYAYATYALYSVLFSVDGLP